MARKMARIITHDELGNSYSDGAYGDFRQEATRLMYKHKLYNWHFIWTPQSKARAAVCKYRTKQLGFAPWIVDWPQDEKTDAILHEIAHALVNERAGHGKVWKAMARKIGAKPERTYENREELTSVRPKGKWVVTCRIHGEVYRMYRKPRVIRSCTKCSPRFDSRYIVIATHEDTGEKILGR